MRILLAEDEKSLNETLVKLFLSEGYSVDSCENGSDALDFLLYTEYDAAVLDIMLPQMDGIQVLREVRRKGRTTPVLLLTALDSIPDRVRGLDSGADDYLIKPFDFQELLARIRVLMRHGSPDKSNLLEIDDLVMDCKNQTVMRAGIPILLTKKEYAVLEYMLRNKSIILSKERIEQHICDYSYEAETNVIKVYIRYLRKKIDDGHAVKLIHTVRNSGYVIRKEEESP